MIEPFGHEKPRDSAGFLLWQTTISWQKLIKEALASYNISHAQFVIMAITHFHNQQNIEVRQIMISGLSKLDKMVVSKNIKQLISKGLMFSTENLVDSRAKTITLSVEGKRLINKLVPIVERIDKKFFSKLANKEKQLINLLDKLTE